VANNRIVWHGLAELRAELRRLPDALRADAAGIVRAAGERTEALTRANYPEKSGNLRKGVGRTEERTRFGIVVTVYSRAFHAHLYETGGAVNRPPAPPEKRLGTHAARERRKMYAELAAMMARHGLEVRGDGI